MLLSHIYTHIHTYTRVHTHIHVCSHIYTHIYIHVHTHVDTYTHICTYVCTHIYMYTHTYVPLLTLQPAQRARGVLFPCCPLAVMLCRDRQCPGSITPALGAASWSHTMLRGSPGPIHTRTPRLQLKGALEVASPAQPLGPEHPRVQPGSVLPRRGAQEGQTKGAGSLRA